MIIFQSLIDVFDVINIIGEYRQDLIILLAGKNDQKQKKLLSIL